MKTAEYEFDIEDVTIHFYHNQQTHRYEIIVDYEGNRPFIVSKAKGEAIAQFLKFFKQSTQQDASH